MGQWKFKSIILQKYTEDKSTFGRYTFGKNIFGKYTFEKFALRFSLYALRFLFYALRFKIYAAEVLQIMQKSESVTNQPTD